MIRVHFFDAVRLSSSIASDEFKYWFEIVMGEAFLLSAFQYDASKLPLIWLLRRINFDEASIGVPFYASTSFGVSSEI